MGRVGRLLLVVVGTSYLLFLFGCTPARRYPERTGRPEEKIPKQTPPSALAWSEIGTDDDIPIRFVPSTSPNWQTLSKFWNPPNATGIATLHFGQSPFGAALALLAPATPAVHIKVPAGLPDPTPHIPKTNPPTLKKWQLGKALFHESLIFVKGDFFSCADCHRPPSFTIQQKTAPYTAFNPPSLINCVYNRHQFWDGRVETLEETLVRSAADEVAERGNAAQAERHAWTGVIKRLRKNKQYVQRFDHAFGAEPTLDATAKALATYMRTILSGNSVYDRAQQMRQKRNGTTLEAKDFAAVLDAKATEDILFGDLKSDQLPQELANGWQLFNGKAGCARCHNGPLFTDHDFHNIGIGESIIFRSEKGIGRIAHLPVGLKARKYMGAFRTPSLRNLRRTAPYMHNGTRETLSAVIRHYNKEIYLNVNQYLAPAFYAEGNDPLRLRLSANERKSLEFFLRALNGGPIPQPVVD